IPTIIYIRFLFINHSLKKKGSGEYAAALIISGRYFRSSRNEQLVAGGIARGLGRPHATNKLGAAHGRTNLNPRTARSPAVGRFDRFAHVAVAVVATIVMVFVGLVAVV